MAARILALLAARVTGRRATCGRFHNRPDAGDRGCQARIQSRSRCWLVIPSPQQAKCKSSGRGAAGSMSSVVTGEAGNPGGGDGESDRVRVAPSMAPAREVVTFFCIAVALERIGPLHCRSNFTVKSPADPTAQKARSRPMPALSSLPAWRCRHTYLKLLSRPRRRIERSSSLKKTAPILSRRNHVLKS